MTLEIKKTNEILNEFNVKTENEQWVSVESLLIELKIIIHADELEKLIKKLKGKK